MRETVPLSSRVGVNLRSSYAETELVFRVSLFVMETGTVSMVRMKTMVTVHQTVQVRKGPVYQVRNVSLYPTGVTGILIARTVQMNPVVTM